VPAQDGWAPLLAHWFGDLSDGFAASDYRKKRFSGGPGFDLELRQRFAALVDAALEGQLEAWRNSSRGRLAYVLLCDQLPRNIFRGEARAFAGDQKALSAAREAVTSGQDLDLQPDERAFLYLPFEHSENLVDQHACVGLFFELREQCPPEKQELVTGYLRYAQQHRRIIRQFGRFPHRNRALGRASSADEEGFLATASGFGQTTT
jgi:uncharacterized protein (DUF924 family)